MTKKDYLAVITNGISGSWARNPVRKKAITECARIFRKDHRCFYDIRKGDKVTVNVIDVTGHNRVVWNDSGFYADNKKLKNPVRRFKHTY